MASKTEAPAPSTPIIPKMPNPEEALEALKNTGTPEKPEDKGPNPKGQEEYVFTIEHVDGAGREWKGTFKNKILSIDDRGNMGLLIPQLTRGARWESLDEDSRYLFTMLAHLTISIIEKPAWFKPGDKEFRQVSVLNKVYAEVSSHEEYFRG